MQNQIRSQIVVVYARRNVHSIARTMNIENSSYVVYVKLNTRRLWLETPRACPWQPVQITRVTYLTSACLKVLSMFVKFKMLAIPLPGKLLIQRVYSFI